jgi:hypothetical protein
MDNLEKELNSYSMNTILKTGALVFFFQSTFAQSIDSLMKEKISEYIAYDRTESNEFIQKFKVYVLYVYSIDSNSFGYTIGYILNAHDYAEFDKYVAYYTEISSEYILLKLKDNVPHFANLIGFSKLNMETRVRIVQKLFPPIPLSGFTYRVSLFLGSFDGFRINGKYYSPDEEIPPQFKELHH